MDNDPVFVMQWLTPLAYAYKHYLLLELLLMCIPGKWKVYCFGENED